MKLLIFLIPTLYAQTDLSKYNLIEHLVGSNSTYKKDVKPDILTIVTVQVDIYDIARTEEKNTGFLFDLYLRMWWNDKRLNYSHLANYSKLELSEGKTKQIWQPDVYFLTDRSPGSNEQKSFNSMVYIHKNGEIVYSQRTSMALRSSFDLKYYPYDEQVCELKMQSFTYTNDSLILKWKKDNPLKLSGVHMTEFLISVGEYSDDDTPLLDQVGDYSTLKGKIVMERTGSAHFFQLYGPSVAILFVSWLALFIDEKRISPRLSVHTGCIIALITQWVGIYFIIPAVSYIRAIDVWMIIHQVLIVCAFLANILSLMARRDDSKKERTFEDSKNEERLLQRLYYITYCVKETKPFKYLCCNCFKRFCCYCEAELDSNESSVISSNNRQAKLIEIVAIIALFGHYIIFLIVYTTCVPSHKVSVIFLLCIGTTGLLCWIFLVALLFCCIGKSSCLSCEDEKQKGDEQKKDGENENRNGCDTPERGSSDKDSKIVVSPNKVEANYNKKQEKQEKDKREEHNTECVELQENRTVKYSKSHKEGGGKVRKGEERREEVEGEGKDKDKKGEKEKEEGKEGREGGKGEERKEKEDDDEKL